MPQTMVETGEVGVHVLWMDSSLVFGIDTG